MKFEFLIACRQTADANLRKTLIELLSKVLEDNLNSFDGEAVERMIYLREQRFGDEFENENGGRVRHLILGFALELPDDTQSAQTVVEEFSNALSETAPIYHAVKFGDSLLQADLAAYAGEIYSLEMKLRRVLSLIYLHAYQASDPYELLRDEQIQPIGKERITAEQMRAGTENQFFYLTFGQYVGLNQRADLKISAMLEVIRSAPEYETFRSEILRLPVQQEQDAVLLAGLRERMDAIERMRNCVAHNRRPSRTITQNYINARPLLDAMLDQYIARWQVA